jgi:uncharacterized protein YaaN involved in tellurite resistance
MLSEADLVQARAIAPQQFDRFFGHTAEMAELGSPAVAGVNSQVGQVLGTIGKVKIPELTAIMRTVNDKMREFRRNHDPGDPKIAEAIEKWTKKLGDWLHGAMTALARLLEDYKGLEKQLDSIAALLIDKRMELLRNIEMCDSLYRANEASIYQLIGVIAVMELMTEEAQKRGQAIVIEPNDPQQHQKEETLRHIADMRKNLEIQASEFKQRLLIACATSPQITNIRDLNYGLAMRLYLLVQLTIPTMKLTVAQWALLLQTDEAAEMTDAVAEGANEAVQAFSKYAKGAVPRITEIIQRPTLTVETIAAVAESISAQADGILAAIDHGRQRRAAVESQIVQARADMSAATERLSAGILNRMVNDALTPSEPPPIPALPSAVQKYAADNAPLAA